MRPDIAEQAGMPASEDLLAQACRTHAQRQLARILSAGHSPFLERPRGGHMRGIDFYSGRELVSAVANSCHRYHLAHDRFPNLVWPRGFNEWVVRAKFFKPLKVPECGNKLLTHTFIPDSCAGEIRCARVISHSAEPHLPPNDAVEPGQYFLKASHGSRMNRQVTYPLGKAHRAALEIEAEKWLATSYGRWTGEWWYSCFQPEILLEEYLGDERFSFNYFCFGDKVALIALHNHHDGETITLGPKLQLLGRKNGDSPPERFGSPALLKKLGGIASRIAAPHRFVRVDFFVKDDGEPILGEMTFSPGSGLSHRPQGVDDYLGRLWARGRAR